MRQKLALIATISMVILAGCAGLMIHEAPPSETDSELAEQYGYEITEQEEISLEENVTVFNYTQDIRFTNWLTIYEKDMDGINLADNETQSPIMFGTISTPSINVSNEELNPLAYQSSTNDIVEIISEETDGIKIHNKTKEINSTHEITGENITIYKYDSTLEVEDMGLEFDGYLYASIIELDEAIVLSFGTHPQAYDEKDNIIELIENTYYVL